ncbi:MAG TPA: arginine deiminase-related protein [bacterium]|nr:arginine deiminase-related protein [bacterium]
MDRPQFLMCPPDYYEVVYEINPWMHIKHKVDQKKAAKQWTAFYDLLTQKLKAKVELLQPVKDLPDLVFTANGGLVYKRLFIRGNFRHKQRQGEEKYFETWFRKKGYLIKTIPKPLGFEGEGDALLMGKELFTGYHFRSDVRAHDVVSGHIKLPYFALKLCDKRFYHLDTCFTPLDEKSALVYLPAFETYARLTLLETVPDLIKVPPDEALKFACNAVVAGRHVVMPEGCPKTVRELAKRGFTAHELDFSQFIKAGGAAKCLALRI